MKKMRITVDEIDAIKKIAKVQNKIDSIKGKNVLFYGGGQHTYYILNCCVLDDYVIRVCDSFKTGTLYSYEIEKASKELILWADTVVISNFYEREQIYKELKKIIPDEKILLLYSHDEQDPIYIYEVEIDAEKLTDLCKEDEWGKQNRYIPWQVKGMGERYESVVEKYFFDEVTKQYYLKWIHQGDKVLDIGAGTGRLSIELQKAGAYVTAVDTSEDMLNVLREKNSDINTVVVDGVQLPLPDASFDKVVSCDAMVHFLNWREFLKEHIRVVKKGGVIVYNMFNDDHLKYISDKKYIRTSYISDCGGYGASVSRKELEAVCRELDIELVEMIPYGAFSQTAFSYGILSHQEMLKLQRWYSEFCGQEKLRYLIGRFEREIVSNCDETFAALNILVFRKK